MGGRKTKGRQPTEKKAEAEESGLEKAKENAEALMSPADRLAIAVGKQCTKEAALIQQKLVTGTMRVALQCDGGDGVSHIAKITAKYIAQLEDPRYTITSKDMGMLMKMMGEEVTRSQSVKVSVNSTDAYLAKVMHSGKEGSGK